MDLGDVLAPLAAADAGGYHAGAYRATEPTALAALALLAHQRAVDARGLLDWLSQQQSHDGSLGISATQAAPGWPTAWGVLAWQAASKGSLAHTSYSSAARNGLDWLLRTKGEPIEYLEHSGHDTSIVGWPWVEGTHSWVEPTALSLLALKHAGRGNHPRSRDAVRLLRDRLLPGGGCNYGNTIVFGQELRPHVQATGVCLLTLAGESDPTGLIAKSIDYLRRELPQTAATASLAYGVLALAAHGVAPVDAESWLSSAARRTLARDRSSYKLALLALAALGTACPLIPTSHREAENAIR